MATDGTNFKRARGAAYPTPELSCDNIECMRAPVAVRVPRDSYWLCPACEAGAPDAFVGGFADRPTGFYTNTKPWNAAKRATWTKRQNGVTLGAHIMIAHKLTDAPVGRGTGKV